MGGKAITSPIYNGHHIIPINTLARLVIAEGAWYEQPLDGRESKTYGRQLKPPTFVTPGDIDVLLSPPPKGIKDRRGEILGDGKYLVLGFIKRKYSRTTKKFHAASPHWQKPDANGRVRALDAESQWYVLNRDTGGVRKVCPLRTLNPGRSKGNWETIKARNKRRYKKKLVKRWANPLKKICKMCGAEFEAIKKKSGHCSPECYEAQLIKDGKPIIAEKRQRFISKGLKL